jgi:hypothetical protein
MKQHFRLSLLCFVSLCALGFASFTEAGFIPQTTKYYINSGLSGYWSFNGQDMTQGGIIRAIDRSGQGNYGLLINMATSTMRVLGKQGQALDFDGTNDVVKVESSYLGGDFTVSAWVKQSPTAGSATFASIVMESDGSARLFALALDRTNQRVCIQTNAVSPCTSNGTYTTVGKWTHVAITNPANGAGINVYLNNIFVESLTTENISAGTEIGIGRYSYLEGTGLFGGVIDDVRIYSRLLTSSEITRLYNISASPSQLNASQVGKVVSGLIGNWTFDGNHVQGTKAFDASGGGSQGTLTGGPTQVSGKLGQALDFDGSNDHVVGTLASAFGSGSKSISAWIYTNGNNTSQTIFSDDFNDGNGTQFKFMVLASTFNYVRYSEDSSGWCTSSVDSIKQERWYHVVVTNPGDTTCRIYINGLEDSADNSMGDNGGTDTNFYIGSDTGFDFFDGFIDDVRIYNRVLTSDEIQRLYSSGASSFNVSQVGKLTNGLLGYWSFDGPDIMTAGTTKRVVDRSGNGNTGIFSTVPPQQVVGKIGQAIESNGASNNVVIANTSFNGTGTLTATAWVYHRNAGNASQAYILGTSAGFQWMADYTNRRLMFVSDNSSFSVSSTGSFTQNQWHFVAVTRDSTGAVVNFYIDGVYYAGSGTSGTPVADTTNWSIGDFETVGVRPFAGKIDELRLYNRILTKEELTRLYNMGR